MAMQTLPRSDFGALRAIRAGAGAPVLLLHGVGLQANVWGPQIDALCADFAVIAPDMPGHGESAGFCHAPALADYTDLIAAALTELAQIGPVVVVGHSMGAMIALDLAARHPGLVRGVVALNAIHRRSAAARAAVIARAAALSPGQTPDRAATLARWFGDDAGPEAAACGAWLRSVDPAGYKAAYAVFANQDGPSDADLTAIRAPALFMTGADDPNSTPAMSRAMAALTPRGRAQIIPGAAHMAPLTHSGVVNAALRALVQGCLP